MHEQYKLSFQTGLVHGLQSYYFDFSKGSPMSAFYSFIREHFYHNLFQLKVQRKMNALWPQYLYCGESVCVFFISFLDSRQVKLERLKLKLNYQETAALLTKHKIVRSKNLSKWPWSNWIHCSRFEINENGSRHIFPAWNLQKQTSSH